MKTIKVSKVCSCGKGYRSRIDGLCEKCRTKRQKEHNSKYHIHLMYLDPKATPDSALGKSLRVKYFGAIYEIN